VHRNEEKHSPVQKKKFVPWKGEGTNWDSHSDKDVDDIHSNIEPIEQLNREGSSTMAAPLHPVQNQ
jgi:hypothetical protein